MKKLLIALFLVFVGFMAIGCTKEAGAPSVVQIDINPSVEFVLDENSLVVSCTALNDDAALILEDDNQSYVGLEFKVAFDKYMTEVAAYGFLNKDDLELNITTTSEASKDDVINAAKDFMKKFCETHKLEITTKFKKAYDGNIKSLLYKMGYTQDDLKGKTSEELIALLKKERIETAYMMAVELREAYYKAKNMAIDMAKYQAFANLVDKLGTAQKAAYAVISSAYETAYNLYQTNVKGITSTYFNYFLSENSAYQKALAAEAQARMDIENAILALDPESPSYNDDLAALQLQKQALEVLEAATVSAKDAVGTVLSNVQKLFNDAKEDLEPLFVTVTNVMQLYISKEELTEEINRVINETKDNFFETFEENNKSKIDAYHDYIESLREELEGNAE